MQDIVAEAALPVFAFYLLVACNYIKEIFGCRLQHVLDNNIYAKHMIAFLLLFFLIVVINPDYADRDIVKNILMSIGIYVWFLITTRVPLFIMIIVLILLISSYIVSITKKRNEKDKNEEGAKRAENWQNGLAYTALGLSIVGFVMYTIEKKMEYKSKFSLLKFISGDIQCRNFTPKSARLI